MAARTRRAAPHRARAESTGPGHGPARARRPSSQPAGSASRSLSSAPHEQLRAAGHPRVIRGHMVGHVVQEQRARCGRPGLRAPRPGFGATEGGVGHIPAHAVRRADHVRGAADPAALPRTRPAGPAFASARASPAGLRSQTPISHTASTPAGVTASQSAAATSARVERPSGGPGQLSQPHRRIDLVDHRLSRPPRHRTAHDLPIRLRPAVALSASRAARRRASPSWG